MSAPAGSCEWCGADQNWTIWRGELYVMCKAGCQDLFQITIPPPDVKKVVWATSDEVVELMSGGGGVGD